MYIEFIIDEDTRLVPFIKKMDSVVLAQAVVLHIDGKSIFFLFIHWFINEFLPRSFFNSINWYNIRAMYLSGT